MWLYVIAAVVIFILLKELIRLPTVGKYEERHVFITGCDTGFGNLLAKRLDSLGFNVYAGCFTERGADELKKVSSARLKTLSLDVSKIESILKAREFVDKHLPENKGLWAVVNNAGIFGPMGATEWFTKKEYVTCLGVNLFGVIDVTRVLQPLLRKGQGRVVNMASVSGRIAVGGTPYVCSKYGIEAFSDCLRRETLHQGISVHIIEPGLFDTNISDPKYMTKAFSDSFRQASPDVQAYYGEKLLQKACVDTGCVNGDCTVGPPPVCVCRPGFQQTVIPNVCEDINECASNPCRGVPPSYPPIFSPYGPNTCENIQGGFRCHCNYPYFPSTNGASCINGFIGQQQQSTLLQTLYRLALLDFDIGELFEF